MKENILKIVNAFLLRNYFINKEFTLTLNYETVIDCTLGADTLALIEEKLKEVDIITSYNFTVRNESGTDWGQDEENIFKKGWKNVSYTFYGSINDDKDKSHFLKETLKCGWFTMNYLGKNSKRESPNFRAFFILY